MKQVREEVKVLPLPGLGDLSRQHTVGHGLFHVPILETAAAAGGTGVRTELFFIHVAVLTWKRMSPGQWTVAMREE